MVEGNFAKKVKDAMSARVPSELTGGIYERNQRPYAHIYRAQKDNFIDGQYPEKCDIKGDLFGEDKTIIYNGATSLNSSQALCINFFKEFFKKEEWEMMLLSDLKDVGVPLESEIIKNAAFEYVPNSIEETNFDYYMEMNNGIRVSVEVKYTESGFGMPKYKENPQKYDKKWNDIYEKMVADCPYLNCDKEVFLGQYQINRNICYAKDGDIVLFITPRAIPSNIPCKDKAINNI